MHGSWSGPFQKGQHGPWEGWDQDQDPIGSDHAEDSGSLWAGPGTNTQQQRKTDAHSWPQRSLVVMDGKAPDLKVRASPGCTSPVPAAPGQQTDLSISAALLRGDSPGGGGSLGHMTGDGSGTVRPPPTHTHPPSAGATALGLEPGHGTEPAWHAAGSRKWRRARPCQGAIPVILWS